MKRSCCALLIACLAVVGCNRSTPITPVPKAGPAVTSEQAFKERVTFIATNGGMGSAFAGIVELAEKSGDATLVADAKQLEKVQSPDKAKAIAKKMLEKIK